MDQLVDHAGEFFARFVVSGPILYIALLMVIDPSRVARFLVDLSVELQRFESHFWNRFPQPILNSAPIGGIGFLRSVGLFVAVLTFLHIARLTG